MPFDYFTAFYIFVQLYKTTKQIADELKIDKQRVYRYIRKNRISEAHCDAVCDTVVKHYDEAAQSLIIRHFKPQTASSDVHHEAHQTASSDVVSDAVILMLKNELEIKNKQIKELTTALLETSKALHATQALHAGTMQKQITAEESHESDYKMQEKPRNIFARFFKK